MRWIILSAMAVGCSPAGARSLVEPVQASLRLTDLASTAWVTPGKADCELQHVHGGSHHNPLNAATVATNLSTKPDPGGTGTNMPVHNASHGHGQTQRVSGEKSATVSIGTAALLIRLETEELLATMAQHEVVVGQAPTPKTYRFQVFNGVSSKVTPTRMADAPYLEVSAADLTVGRLALLASLGSSTRPAPTWVVAIRASSSDYTHGWPILRCTLRP